MNSMQNTLRKAVLAGMLLFASTALRASPQDNYEECFASCATDRTSFCQALGNTYLYTGAICTGFGYVDIWYTGTCGCEVPKCEFVGFGCSIYLTM